MLRLAVLSSAVVVSLLAVAGAHAAPPAAPKSAAGPAAPPSQDTVRKGVVQVEQGGRPLAVGMVLSKDGRVLTSLSALGAATDPELRYADGSVVKAKIGHKDKSWDLALLIPQSGRWLDGLVPSQDDPGSGELKAFLPKGGKLASTAVGFKGRTDAASKEGEALKSALELDLKGSPSVPGAPIIDANGKVVGVLVRACKDAGESSPAKGAKETKPPPCAPLTVGAPVYALRSFLMKTPATAVIPSPWLGLGGAPNEAGNFKGVKVMGVAPGSPAEKAGLKAGEGGDMIVAVDGQPVETPEQLAEAIAKHAIGHTVKFLVFNAGKLRETPGILRPAP